MLQKAFASSVSEHPLPTHAIGEVVGDVLDVVGPSPDIAVLFVTAPLVGVLEDLVAVVEQLLSPGTLVGTTAVSVMSGAREVEETPAVSLWAANVGVAAAVQTLRLEAQQRGSAVDIVGLPDELDAAATLVLLADPFTFPADRLLAEIERRSPGMAVVGGLASAARGPGGNRLLLNGQLYTDGAVGLLLGPEIACSTVVSQGCRPIGDPFTVTSAEENLVHELGGRPALERLEELVAAATPEERALLAAGVHIGIVANEHRESFGRGDFVIRGVLGADKATRSLAIGDEAPLGAVVQFQVRDATTASEDLHALHADSSGAKGALVFTCNGRGTYLFGEPHHDAAMVHDLTDGAALSGMFCAGEIGPVNGTNHLHGFTASTLLFR